MSLERYRRKRDFGRTPEPAGREGDSRDRPLLFVVQKHDASRLHYDFRLEWEGVLKSWAVPKGPSLAPGVRRLAVRTEDHPLEYGDFEGVIPEGEYGGGSVLVWDRGAWRPLEDPAKGLDEGRLAFRLEGEKLKGEWRLVRTRDAEGDAEEWLLIKKKDPLAASPDDPAVVETRPDSVLTGRSIEEVAADSDRLWGREGERAPDAGSRGRVGPDPASLRGARSAPLPAAPRPALATLVETPPAGEEWIHEMKYDGYRILVRLEGGRARLISRNGNDWTDRFASIARAADRIVADSALLDGEVVIFDERGISDFQALQNALKDPAAELRYVAFDLLHLGGRDLTGAPLLQRKDALRGLLAASAPLDGITFGDHLTGKGGDLFDAACRSGAEGIVSKRVSSRYTPRRTRDWLKAKCTLRQEFVVVGFSEPSGSRVGLGSLLLGVHGADGDLVYAGRVGTGFTDADLRALRDGLERLERETPPVVDPPSGADVRDVHWIDPRMVVEVEFTEWTGDGRIRHSAFRGVRQDRDPEEVVREEAGPVEGPRGAPPSADPAPAGAGSAATDEAGAGSSAPAVADADDAAPTVAGVRLSSPDRVLWPEQGVTKRELAEYYTAVADRALPHLVDRPLTLLRCPSGRHEECFYQKRAHPSIPEMVPRIPIEEGDGETDLYTMLDGLPALVALVQVGVLEVHVWGSRKDRLERPDRMIFDLDPGPDVVWPRVALAAVELRDRLADLGLESWLKSTGGKGLHVVVPLVRRSDWTGVKAFARAVAEEMAEASPDEFTSQMPKRYRKGRIFVDYLRNDRNATAIGPYSARARPGAPVAFPMAWGELAEHEELPRWTVRDAPSRLSDPDPWKEMVEVRQSITRSMRRAVGLADG